MRTSRGHKIFRNILLLLIIIILGYFLIPTGIYYLTTSKAQRDLSKLKYNEEVINIIIDKKIDDYLITNKIYSKTLEEALIEKKYQSKLLKEYIFLPYRKYDNYIAQINSLNDIGYKRLDIDTIFKKLTNKQVDIIISKKTIISGLTDYLNNKYFAIDNLDRYINYKTKNSSYDYNKIILYVNMFLDYPYYSHIINIDNPDDPLVIVNKYYKLSSTFIPKNLVKIDNAHSYHGNSYQVIPIVKENLDIMFADMEKVGLKMQVKSAYRSYQMQVTGYNEYVAASGEAIANTFSAKPGHSEHQTGMALDFVSAAGEYSVFSKTAEYAWVKDNAYKYGFIQRYQDNKNNITGYQTESWHFRYVGKDIAKYIYDNNLTFDEYYAMFIANK